MTIVSHSHGYIFLKTRKTAGTSVEKWLSGALRPGDWITTAPENLPLPVGIWDTANTVTRFGRLERGLKRVCRYGLGWPPGPRFREHMEAGAVRAAVGEAIWTGYFSFAIERDPWDRIISLWRWRQHARGAAPDFDGFLDAIEADGTDLATRGYSNMALYTIDGRIAVDRIIRYNDLCGGLARLCSDLALPLSPGELPFRKAGHRDSADSPHALTIAQVARIARICAEEIDLLGWDYRKLYGAPQRP
ncbi:sulfotransferase family 2 domain-containing protein [Rhodovulum steppense]|uniref:Sulfotransferase family protein n=1 Tax=Rhodovulum steppense TaxID=540251 RepID=A0A4R1YT58_9RHOB|nr:sulfotransferase family 2 domain-containing protein [Rhodovulum steppense]TCM82645.1 sulfotransferase family protein [Rhodovulum steppense]